MPQMGITPMKPCPMARPVPDCGYSLRQGS